MIAYQIVDAQGTFRFMTNTIPCCTREDAETLVSAYTPDDPARQESPEWFPMVIIEVEWDKPDWRDCE